MSRGQVGSEVRDPAMAVAMAKCWTATWARGGGPGLPPVDSFHPDECGFCEVPRDILIRQLEEFVTWSGISSHAEDVPLRAEIEAWETLKQEQQQSRVRRVMGFNTDRGADPDDRRSPW